MLKFGKKVVKFRIPIFILSILLLLPAGYGYINTMINYDVLSYLPGEVETMKGQIFWQMNSAPERIQCLSVKV